MTGKDSVHEILKRELSLISLMMDLSEELEKLSARRGRLMNSRLKEYLGKRIEAVRALPDVSVLRKLQDAYHCDDHQAYLGEGVHLEDSSDLSEDPDEVLPF